MARHVEKLLTVRPYIAGEAFSAADTQGGAAIHYSIAVSKVLPERPPFTSYLERLAARPAFPRFMAKDLEMAKATGMAA